MGVLTNRYVGDSERQMHEAVDKQGRKLCRFIKGGCFFCEKLKDSVEGFNPNEGF